MCPVAEDLRRQETVFRARIRRNVLLVRFGLVQALYKGGLSQLRAMSVLVAHKGRTSESAPTRPCGADATVNVDAHRCCWPYGGT